MQTISFSNKDVFPEAKEQFYLNSREKYNALVQEGRAQTKNAGNTSCVDAGRNTNFCADNKQSQVRLSSLPWQQDNTENILCQAF